MTWYYQGLLVLFWPVSIALYLLVLFDMVGSCLVLLGTTCVIWDYPVDVL
jgi:hypothetical protein